jgi:hypothetical protein
MIAGAEADPAASRESDTPFALIYLAAADGNERFQSLLQRLAVFGLDRIVSDRNLVLLVPDLSVLRNGTAHVRMTLAVGMTLGVDELVK